VAGLCLSDSFFSVIIRVFPSTFVDKSPPKSCPYYEVEMDIGYINLKILTLPKIEKFVGSVGNSSRL